MPSWTEIRLGCRGLFRLARFDRSFLGYFDRSAAGAVRSFGLALLLLPAFLWLAWLDVDQQLPSTVLYLTAKVVAYAYGWILFPFVLLTAGRLLDRDGDAVGCITIYNWINLLWTILQLPVSALGALDVAPNLVGLLSIGIFVATLVIEGFMFTVAMRLQTWQSATLVTIDVVLGQGVIWPISDWLGCAPPA